MVQVVVDGYFGGKLLVDEAHNVTAFFNERFADGSPCEVFMGRLIDDLLALKPEEHLSKAVKGVDDIYAGYLPLVGDARSADVILYVKACSSYESNLIAISQARLARATRWATTTPGVLDGAWV